MAVSVRSWTHDPRVWFTAAAVAVAGGMVWHSVCHSTSAGRDVNVPDWLQVDEGPENTDPIATGAGDVPRRRPHHPLAAASAMVALPPVRARGYAGLWEPGTGGGY
jgi:hypothetical protein